MIVCDYVYVVCSSQALLAITVAFSLPSHNYLILGDSGALEMSWVDVPGDKLFEPVVTMVCHFFSFQ